MNIKVHRVLGVLLIMFMGVFAAALMFPQVTKPFPKLEELIRHAKYLFHGVAAHSTPSSTGVVEIASATNLTPAQAQFLEQHQHRYQLLHAALANN